MINMLIVVILGLIIGSFLNVVILRFDELESVVKTRSHCPKCKKNLNWFDLIPVLSFVFLFGRCRYCKANISLQYPLVELATAAVFGLLFWQFGLTLEFVFLALIASILIIIFVYDMLKLQISDFLVWLLFGLWLAWLLVDYFLISHDLSTLTNSLYGGLALGGFLGLIVAISKEQWMGAGDIGLGFVLGAIAGWPNVLVSSLSAFVLGAVVGLVLIAVKKKKLQSQVPFAPFLILGLFVALFASSQIFRLFAGGIF